MLASKILTLKEQKTKKNTHAIPERKEVDCKSTYCMCYDAGGGCAPVEGGDVCTYGFCDSDEEGDRALEASKALAKKTTKTAPVRETFVFE